MPENSSFEYKSKGISNECNTSEDREEKSKSSLKPETPNEVPGTRRQQMNDLYNCLWATAWTGYARVSVTPLSCTTGRNFLANTNVRWPTFKMNI